MDSTAANIMGIIGFVMSIGGGIYSAVNHKRIRSKCCGTTSEASLDIESTTPPKNTIVAPPTAE